MHVLTIEVNEFLEFYSRKSFYKPTLLRYYIKNNWGISIFFFLDF